ncbi:hypothetical protein [Streptomyces sp. NPDC005865]|uniref:hypothetical protein n=1 Tax=Streptomyces sp. NPDC005865 TaxID=3155453 RepID=UPI0034043BCC
MQSGHKAMTGFVTVLLALVLVIVGLVTGWPLWAWPITAGALAAVTAVALSHARRQRPLIPPERLLEPELPIPPVERWERVVKDVSLPSLSDDYDFQFSATVRWVPQDAPANAPLVNAGGLAIDAVVDRARSITHQSPPNRSSLVQHRLNGELATMVADPSGRVLAMAENVRLVLSDADRERLEKLATVRKNEEVWEHERKYEQSKRAYLGEDVLKTPGSAVVWWLSKNNDQIDKTVSDIGLLAELSSAANDQPVPDDFHRFVPGLAQETGEQAAPDIEGDRFGSGPATPDDYARWLLQGSGLPADDPRGGLYVERMADAAKGAGLPDVADALLRLLGEHFPTPEDPGPSEPPFDDPYAEEPPYDE